LFVHQRCKAEQEPAILPVSSLQRKRSTNRVLSEA
jgi:hypothetical protein